MMPAFDPALEAKSTLKERMVWMLYMGILFFLLYGAANRYAALGAPHPSFPMKWESAIPFVPEFIVPYMSSDLIFVAAFLLPYTRLQLRILSVRVLFIVVLSCLVFFFYPLQYAFERPVSEHFRWLFGLLEADLPFNQLPSLHVAFAVVLWHSMRPYLKGVVRFFTAAWLWLVVLSTLLVYQHHFIDLPAGALVGYLAVWLIREERVPSLLYSFTTPRSLKMALYYTAASVLLTVAAFTFSGVWVLFSLWGALSTLLVGAVYAFGLNSLLAGRKARASWLHWTLLGPYYLGNYLSWQFFRRKIPLVNRLEEEFYIGRQPAPKEYRTLQKKGVCRVIHLAPEQQLQRASLPQIRLAMLDQTIQPPELLHQGVMAIEAHRGEGLFVHCTLGMSRTVLLAAAWCIYRGESVEEVLRRIERARPRQVKAAYMRITLRLYRDYLQQRGLSILRETLS